MILFFILLGDSIANADNIAVLCAVSGGQSFESSGNTMTIRMITDDGGNSEGFSIRHKAGRSQN